MSSVKLIAKKSSTFHDFPYTDPKRKCIHCWIINVTPPGPSHCIHRCTYCYAREAIYSNYSEDTLIYNNLPELVEKDLNKICLCPPISISNISDPCQDIPELRSEVKRLVQMLMNYGVSFAITTKGDPSFLLDIPDFADYEPKVIATTIEGNAEILQLLSPQAPPFYSRLMSISKMSSLNIRTLIRFDPVFIHLFQALYAGKWWDKVTELMDTFAAVGAKHIICGTGRLSKKPSPDSNGKSTSSWQRLFNIIYSYSPLAAARFEKEYKYEINWAGRGYQLRKNLRREFHNRLREIVESKGMTYATCQELAAKECDSRNIPHCKAMPLPFTRKGLGGKFYPIAGCTANCHISCNNLVNPPCGKPLLVTPKPLRISNLR